jgi:hypothetical protein
LVPYRFPLGGFNLNAPIGFRSRTHCEDCHRDDSAVFGWCRGKGPHPRSIDAAIVDSEYTAASADYLMIFNATIWHIISSGLRVKHARSVCSPDKRQPPDAFEFLPGCSQCSGRDPTSIAILAAPCFVREYGSRRRAPRQSYRAADAALRSAAVAAKRRIRRTQCRASTERA